MNAENFVYLIHGTGTFLYGFRCPRTLNRGFPHSKGGTYLVNVTCSGLWESSAEYRVSV